MTISKDPQMTDPVDLALALVRSDTVNPPGQEEACAEHLAALLEEAGLRVERHALAPGRVSLIARLDGSDGALPPLALTGHIDTVPLGERAWSVDPFGELRGDKLYGRGASDMKAGVAAVVAAAVAASREGRRQRGVCLVITAGEETGSAGAVHLAAAGVLGRASALVVAEPTSNRLAIAHKGALHLRARSRGRTAHGSMPECGDNAILKAARAARAIDALRFPDEPHPLLGAPTATVTSIHGGGPINVVPDAALLTVDIRTLPGMRHAAVLDEVARALGADATLDPPVVDLPAVGTAADDPFVRCAAGVVERAGLDAGLIGLPYFTDGSVLQPAFDRCPTVILGPGEAGQAHQTDEFCFVAKIHEAAALYRDLIEAWCGSPG
jgi:succinyl-diaminopimelate desuccinylase